MQRFVLFFHGGRPTDRQLIVSLSFPVLGVALTKWNFRNNAHTNIMGVGNSAAVEYYNRHLHKNMMAVGQIVSEAF